LPFGDVGSSWEDYALTDMGLALGTMLSLETIQPAQAGDWLRHNLSEPWPNGPVWFLNLIAPLPGTGSRNEE
jgi:hypothetical protein